MSVLFSASESGPKLTCPYADVLDLFAFPERTDLPFAFVASSFPLARSVFNDHYKELQLTRFIDPQFATLSCYLSVAKLEDF